MGTESRLVGQGPTASLSRDAPTPGGWLSKAHSPFTGKMSHVRPRCPLPLLESPVTSGSWPSPSPTVYCLPV